MSQPADVDIAICTFQRPHIVETLASLAQVQVPDGLDVRIIVVDNDDTPSAKDRVTGCDLPFRLSYVHAPGRNISIARNACLETATAPILIFIDDDELVAAGWLAALLEEQRRSDADVVLGPAISIYPEDAPDWMRSGDHHSSRPIFVDGKIRTGYGCNTLLMRMRPCFEGLLFRHDLGRVGGEDTIFLASVHRRGGHISYAADAIVTEEVLPQRARLKWLVQRKLRFGQTHGLMLLADMDGGFVPQVREAMRAGLKCTYCMVMALVNMPFGKRGIPWLLRGCLHAGVVFFFLGGRTTETYGKDQPT